METRANYVLIGAFVLMAAAALTLFVVWIAKEPFSRNLETYDVVFEGPVNGLGKGGEVRFNGIKVGEVQRLSLDRQDPNRVIARINVDAETPVRVDSVAQLNLQGVTGVTFIQILAGSPDKPMLQRSDPNVPAIIRSEHTAIDELLGGGKDLVTTISDVTQQLDSALSPENVAHISGILADVHSITSRLAAKEGLIDDADKTLRSINVAAVKLSTAIDNVSAAAKTFDTDFHGLSGKADSALTELQPAIEDVRKAMTNLNGAVAQINTQLTPTANHALQQLSLTASDLRALMLRIQGLAAEVEQDPSRFIYQRPQPVQ